MSSPQDQDALHGADAPDAGSSTSASAADPSPPSPEDDLSIHVEDPEEPPDTLVDDPSPIGGDLDNGGVQVSVPVSGLPSLAPSSSSPDQRSLQSAKAKSLPVTGQFTPLSDPSVLPELMPPGPPLDQPPFARKAPEEEQAYWKEQIQTYEREAAGLGQDPRAAPLALEIGRIYEEHLGRPRNAATSYQRAFTLDPKNPAVLHASRRLFTEVGNWGMVLEILGFEVEGAESPESRASLLAEQGLIHEEKIKDLETAQACFEASLDAWSAEPLAVAALERIHLVQKGYDKLQGVYARALEATDKPERRLPLLIAAAQLAEDRLDDPHQAIAYYQAVLEIDPDNALALEALGRLLMATEQWEAYVDILTRSATRSESPEQSAQLLLTAGRVLNERLQLADRAVHVLLQALEHAPADLVILREIERLYDDNERYDEVAKVLRREAEITTEPREAVPIRFKLGTLLEDRLGQPEEAITILQDAVRAMPEYTPARQSLGRLLGKHQRWDELAALFELEAQREEDPSVRVSKLFQLADLRVTRLDKVDEAVAVLRESLTIQPDYQPARRLLLELLTKAEAWSDLVVLYEQELELAQNQDQQVFLLTRIGTFALDKLSDYDVAARAFGRIQELVPGHLNAIRSLVDIAEKREDWNEALRLYELEVEATQDQKEVVAILHRAGVLREQRLSDVDGAIEHFEKALTLNPTYLPALRSLGRLYSMKERWEDLLGMYRREMDVTRSDEHRVQLLFRSADILADRLSDPERAAETLQKVLEVDDSNLPAMRALAELHAHSGAYEPLVEVLQREAASVPEAKEKTALQMQVAEVLEERLGRADQAAEVYQDVIRLGHHIEPAMRALVRIYSAEGQWHALSRALQAAKDHADRTEAKVAILLRLAEVAGDKLGNMDRAAEHLEEALTLQPGHNTVLNQLQRTSVGRRDWPRAIAVASELALHEGDPRLFASRHIRIAQMKETQLDPPESGAEHYRLALQTVPDHPVALRALELAYRRADNWEALATFYQREALVSKTDARRAGFFARAGDIAEHRLRDDVRSAEMYERALELQPDLLHAVRGRRRVAERRGDAQIALDSIRREGELTADPTRAEELLFEAGRVHEEKFGQVDQAALSYRGILERSPGNTPAFNRLERIYREAEEHESLVALYETRALAVDDVAEQTALYFKAGEVAEMGARLEGRPDQSRAIAFYGQALQRDPRYADALVRLGPLLVQAEDWDAALDVLHQTLAVTKEPSVRGQTLDSLGIIYHEHRQDLVKCVQSLQAALQIDPRDEQSLERLSKVYKEAQDWTSAVNVMLRLAEVQEGAGQKIATLLDLAELYEVRLQDDRSAILANRKVLELDPANQSAILRLSRLHERAHDWQALADVSARYVSLLPAEHKDRAAPLHMKMAEVFEREMGDDARAINALKYALDARPDDPDALLRLANLYAKNPETTPQAVDAHRRLLRLDPYRVDSYHVMHRLFEARGEHDKAFVVAEILVFLRAALQDEELYYQEHKAKVAARPERALTAVDHDRLVTHPGERGPLRAVMELLGPELHKSFPGNLERFDLNRGADRHGPKSPMAMRRLADELAEALGDAPAFDLWVTKKFEHKVFAENDRPLALVIGTNVARRIQEKDQRFLLGRAIEQLKGGHHLLSVIPPKELEALVWAVAKSAQPSGQAPVDPASMDAMQRILRGLPGRIRRALDEVGGALFTTHVDLDRHRAAAAHTGNRAGLVMSNDIEVAVRNLAKDHPNVRPVFRDSEGARQALGQIPAVGELLGYAVSEEYFKARARLGFSIQLGL